MSGATDTFVALMSGEYAARSRKETPEAYLEWKGGRVACTAPARLSGERHHDLSRPGAVRDAAQPSEDAADW